MGEIVLIAGGSGLIGQTLTHLLHEKGYTIRWLSRSGRQRRLVEVYKWNPEKGEMDISCLNNVDHIVCLSGANIGAKRWTKKRKKLLLNSRLDSINLIHKALKATPNKVKSFISAAGSSFYGNRGDELLSETSLPRQGFLSNICQQWENATDPISDLGIRTVKIRTGFVLSAHKGALPRIIFPIKLGLGALMGNGKQWVSWIHVKDICRLYIHAIENQAMQGVYNGTSPHPVNNRQFFNAIAHAINRSIFLPNVPQWLLSLWMGEMSQLVFDSFRMSAEKTINSGFSFKYPHIEEALEACFSD